MPSHRPPRFAAWIALVAILLSTVPTAGAHFLGTTANLVAGSDYCSSVGSRDVPPANPSPAGHDHRLSHCDGCTGSSGNGVALTGAVAPATARRGAPPAIVSLATPTPSPADLIAAPPRGPPHFA